MVFAILLLLGVGPFDIMGKGDWGGQITSLQSSAGHQILYGQTLHFVRSNFMI
jgi:hypothetical protein